MAMPDAAVYASALHTATQANQHLYLDTYVDVQTGK